MKKSLVPMTMFGIFAEMSSSTFAARSGGPAAITARNSPDYRGG